MTTKAGLHIIGDPSEYVEWIGRMGCQTAVVMGCSSIDNLLLVKAHVPYVVLRFDDGGEWRHWTPDAYMAMLEPYLSEKGLAGHGFIWSLPNEPGLMRDSENPNGPALQETIEDARRLNALTLGIAQRLSDRGEQSLGWNFPTGNPVHLEVIRHLIPSYRAMTYRGADVYWAPQLGNDGFSDIDRDALVEAEIAKYVSPADRKGVIWKETGCDSDGTRKGGGYKGNGLSDAEYVYRVVEPIVRRANARREVIGINFFTIGGDWISFQLWALRQYLLGVAERNPIPEAA